MDEIDPKKFKLIEEAYRKEYDIFIRTACKYSEQEAEDILQQAIVNLAKSNIEINDRKHASSLITIGIKWEGLLTYKKHKRKIWLENKAKNEETPVHYQFSFLDKEIEERILRLTPKEKNILVKKIFHGLTMREISEHLSLNLDHLYDTFKTIIKKINGTYHVEKNGGLWARMGETNGKSKPCVHKETGEIYPSLSDACKSLGLNYKSQINKIIRLKYQNRQSESIFEYIQKTA